MGRIGGLPEGCVTLVFTDIEGSTKLVQRLGADRWMQVLDEHNSILRSAFAASNGVELKTEGDSFFVVFADAADALTACLEGQLGLSAHDFGPDSVRVRMGMHTGEAAVVGHDYIGLAVHEAARVSSAAHGGQIVVSEGTRAAAGDALPNDASWRDLGRHALKDLFGQRSLFQLAHPGLRPTFPPLRTLSAVEHNLPAPPTGLVGRQTEKEQASSLLLDDARLVTLTGPGGIGKTRLALEVADDLRAYHSGGVWFIALAGVRDATAVVPAIAEVLGVREHADGDLIGGLHRRLAGGPALLVLDNLEQVLDAATDIAELLAAVAQLRVLATSRERLRLRVEHVVVVPPLGVEEGGDGTELFCRRATALGFPLDDASQTSLARVVGALGGIPLAIELAAARLPDVGLDGLISATSSLLDVLTEGERDLPVRQQTLRAAIRWSYDLLDAEQKTLFARLSVFAGAIPVGAVAHVCATDEPHQVDVLVAKSLLQATGERLVMLEPVRQYAAEILLERDETTVGTLAHARWFTAFAQDADLGVVGPAQARWLRDLDAQHDNLRVALEYARAAPDLEVRLAGSLARYWYIRGHWSEGRAALERALGVPVVDPGLRGIALVGAGAIAIAQSDLAAAERNLGDAYRCGVESNDPHLRARAANGLAEVARQRGDLDVAHGHLSEARRLAGDDQTLLALVVINEGLLALTRGDLVAAARAMDSAVTINAELGDRRGEALAVLNRGRIAHLSGDLGGAEKLSEQALEALTTLGEQAGAAAALENLSTVLAQKGAAEEALAALEQLRHLRRHLGDEAGELRALGQLGETSSAVGRFESSLAWHADAASLASRSDNFRLQAALDLGRATALKGLSRLDEAAAHVESAAALFERAGDPDDASYYRRYAESLRADATAAGASAPAADRT